MTVVQRSPDVGLALRMQRLPQAAPPAAGGGTGGGLIGPALLRESMDYAWGGEIQNRVYEGEWRLVRGDIEIDSEVEVALRALIVGGGVDVEWSWTVDQSHMVGVEGEDWIWSGVSVVLQDGTLQLRVLTGHVYLEVFMYSLLTMTATVGGEVVGQIVLRITFNYWAEEP